MSQAQWEEARRLTSQILSLGSAPGHTASPGHSGNLFKSDFFFFLNTTLILVQTPNLIPHMGCLFHIHTISNTQARLQWPPRSHKALLVPLSCLLLNLLVSGQITDLISSSTQG